MEPLAFRMRPKKLEDIVGQEHLLTPGTLLHKAITGDALFSFLLWGPPGTGKTSLAKAIAGTTEALFVNINAVSSGVKDLRTIVLRADEERRGLFQRKTILFIDEIHRFNKAQQDFLLPYVEAGTITLIGATTENPSFEVNAALLSRLKVFVLKELSPKHVVLLLSRALEEDSYIKASQEVFTPGDIHFLAQKSFGDARWALNTLEQLVPHMETLPHSQKERERALLELIQNRLLRYDKSGEEHYNIISALHKSMRDSDVDAAIYWTVRMIDAGEDPKYIVRRMIRFASEDIGLADPQALTLAIAVKENVLFVGSPECNTALVELAAYLAAAPKDNRCYTALQKAQTLIRETGPLPVPLHLRNAPTKLMKSLDYGKGYKYAHDFQDAQVEQEHLPDSIKGIQLF